MPKLDLKYTPYLVHACGCSSAQALPRSTDSDSFWPKFIQQPGKYQIEERADWATFVALHPPVSPCLLFLLSLYVRTQFLISFLQFTYNVALLIPVSHICDICFYQFLVADYTDTRHKKVKKLHNRLILV